MVDDAIKKKLTEGDSGFIGDQEGEPQAYSNPTYLDQPPTDATAVSAPVPVTQTSTPSNYQPQTRADEIIQALREERVHELTRETDELEAPLSELGLKAGRALAGGLSDAIVSALSDLSLDPVEKAVIKDAKKRLGASPEAIVSEVTHAVYQRVRNIQTSKKHSPEEKEMAAAKGLEAAIDSALMFDNPLSRDRIYKIGKLYRMLKTNASLIPGLMEKLQPFEDEYVNKYHFDSKIITLTHPNLSKELGMQLSLIETLKQLIGTVDTDLHVDPEEFTFIQGAYNQAPITKLELLKGLCYVLKGLYTQVESMEGFTEKEKDALRKKAVESAILVREELLIKTHDKSNPRDLDSEVYALGRNLGSDMSRIAKYKKSFENREFDQNFLNIAQGAVEDNRIDPLEYKLFHHELMLTDKGIEEGLMAVAELQAFRLKNLYEQRMKELGNNLNALQNAKRQDIINHMNPISELITYWLGAVPQKGNNTTAEYLKLIGKCAERLLDFETDKETFDKKQTTDADLEKKGEFFVKKLQVKTEGKKTREMEIREGIMQYKLPAYSMSVDEKVLDGFMGQNNFIELVPGKETHHFSGGPIAVAQKMGDHYVVFIGGKKTSSFGRDYQTGLVTVNLGRHVMLTNAGKLENIVNDNGMLVHIDSTDPKETTRVFMEKGYFDKPTAQETLQEDAKYLPLFVTGDDTFTGFGTTFGLQSVAEVSGIHNVSDTDTIKSYAAARPGKVRINYDEATKPGILVLPLLNGGQSDYCNQNDGMVLAKVKTDEAPRKINGSKMLIPLESAGFVRGRGYNVKQFVHGEVFAETVYRPTEEKMYLNLCTDPNDPLFGTHLVFMNAEKTETKRVNFSPFTMMKGAITGIKEGTVIKQYIN